MSSSSDFSTWWSFYPDFHFNFLKVLKGHSTNWIFVKMNPRKNKKRESLKRSKLTLPTFKSNKNSLIHFLSFRRLFSYIFALIFFSFFLFFVSVCLLLLCSTLFCLSFSQYLNLSTFILEPFSSYLSLSTFWLFDPSTYLPLVLHFQLCLWISIPFLFS